MLGLAQIQSCGQFANGQHFNGARRSAHSKQQSHGKHNIAVFVAAMAKNGVHIWWTGSVDWSCACIVFVMKPPRPPVQALVDSRAVIFCEGLSEEMKAKVYTQDGKVIRNSRLR